MNLRRIFTFLFVLLFIASMALSVRFFTRYRVSDRMEVAIEEVSTADYPEDPSHRSENYDRYSGRKLTFAKRDATHFDFVFSSDNPDIATVTLSNVDLSLFMPTAPEWVKQDKNLEIIALTDQEWNRQQVRFFRYSPELSVVGGDGFERDHLYTVELARNCLNAGLWEIILTVQEAGKKAMYYQGWFTLPLGHYKEVFEHCNQMSYWKHWYRLEHWFNPQGRVMDLVALRTVVEETEVTTVYDPDEQLILDGEQLRKSRTFNGKNVRCWGDICRVNQQVSFATFRPPGRYSVDHPWGNEFERIANFKRAIVRSIRPANGSGDLHEVELVFGEKGHENRFIVSGIDLNELKRLPVENYSEGLYMPMGIGVGPFYQSYEELKRNPRHESPYFSVLVDSVNRWINHHDVGIDGPVMHRDQNDPTKVHLYLLSYERHTLVAHFILDLG